MTENPYNSEAVAGLPAGATSSSSRPFLTVAVTAAIFLVLVFLLLPMRRNAPEAARRTVCRNNLKQIGLAFHNYHDVYSTFPPSYTVDADGRPLHSWRTLILPYIDQQNLYDRIDLSKPWDDPANAALLQHIPGPYRCPSAVIPENHTTYLAVASPGSCFESGRATKIAEISDGTSNTLLAIEVTHSQSVPWMAPFDDDGRILLTLEPQAEHDPDREPDVSHEGIIHGLLADGSVQALSLSTEVDTLRSLTTIAGNEIIAEY